MRDRQERILIPAAIAFISMLTTLWASAGLTNTPFIWLPFILRAKGNELSALLQFLVAVGAANLGIGYVCQCIFTFLMFIWPKIRFIDFDRLVKAFGLLFTVDSKFQSDLNNNRISPELREEFENRGLPLSENIEIKSHKKYHRWTITDQGHGRMHTVKKKNSHLNIYPFGINTNLSDRKIEKALRELLLAELHIRLHSHAPQSLIDHCSRRNSAWYIALNSTIASFLGWGLAFLVMLSNPLLFNHLCNDQLIGFRSTWGIFLIVFPGLLFFQAWRWNSEFWQVCWKWVVWDLIKHPTPADWLSIDLMRSYNYRRADPDDAEGPDDRKET